VGNLSIFGTELGCKVSWKGEVTVMVDRQGDEGKSVDGSNGQWGGNDVRLGMLKGCHVVRSSLL